MQIAFRAVQQLVFYGKLLFNEVTAEVGTSLQDFRFRTTNRAILLSCSVICPQVRPKNWSSADSNVCPERRASQSGRDNCHRSRPMPLCASWVFAS